jgi:tetratricopeptide (TPR) repeat protein
MTWMMQQKLKLASSCFLRVLEVDPGFQDAHLQLAWCYAMEGHPALALDEVRRELDLRPDHLRAKGLEADLLMQLERWDEAIHAWRGIQEKEPENPDVMMNLPALLFRQGQVEEGYSVLQTFVAAEPKDLLRRLWMVEVLLANGQTEKGLSLLFEVARDEENPFAMVRSATILADQGQKLDQALALGEKALKRLESVSTFWRENPQTGQMGTCVLLENWGTLGWIRFQQGDLKGAEALLGAAWHHSQDPVQGERLAQVFERQGRKRAAAAQYALAAACVDANRVSIESRYQRLTALSLDQTRSFQDARGVRFSRPDARLGELRTLPVPSKTKRMANAAFLLLIGPRSIESAIPVGGDGGSMLGANASVQKNVRLPVAPGFQGIAIRQGILTSGPGGGYLTLMACPLIPRNPFGAWAKSAPMPEAPPPPAP